MCKQVKILEGLLSTHAKYVQTINLNTLGSCSEDEDYPSLAQLKIIY